MLEFKNVFFSYAQGNEKGQLRGINLKIHEGEVILICGESGCGKTTLTRLVNGLIPNYYEGVLNGEILLDGKNISEMPLYDISAQVGSVFQNPRSQFFNVDTTSELAFGCENLGMPKKEILRRIEKTVHSFGIKSLMDRSIFALSGGEMQKVACASVAAMEPKIFVLDEPSSNLDIASIRELAQVISLWKHQKKTILIAEHRLYYLMQIADRVLYMQEGQIVRDMNIEEFKKITPDMAAEMGLRSLQPVVLHDTTGSFINKADVRLNDFHFTYGKREVLHIPELSVPKGEVIGILGNNGAGKTTFARCLCGLEKRASGKMRLDDVVYNAKQRLSACYLVMQDVNRQLFTESVLDEILLSMDSEDDSGRKTADKILQSLNLSELKDRHPMSLSGGQKQRVAIGSAIASNRKITVFDEPTSGLDYRHMLEVAHNMRFLTQQGKTVFLITHDFELLAQCCNYIVFIENGRVSWSGDWNEETKLQISKFFKEQ